MNMNEIRESYQADLELVKDAKELAAFWTKYLSKTGSIQGLMAGIKSVPKEEKKAYGQMVNDIKTWAQDLYDAKKVEVEKAAMAVRYEDETVDVIEDILENPNLDTQQKQKISELLSDYTSKLKTQTDTENLIKAKTGSECVVIINEDKCQVILEKNTLNDTLILQITEIIEKNTNISAENLTIIEIK